MEAVAVFLITLKQLKDLWERLTRATLSDQCTSLLLYELSNWTRGSSMLQRLSQAFSFSDRPSPSDTHIKLISYFSPPPSEFSLIIASTAALIYHPSSISCTFAHTHLPVDSFGRDLRLLLIRRIAKHDASDSLVMQRTAVCVYVCDLILANQK